MNNIQKGANHITSPSLQREGASGGGSLYRIGRIGRPHGIKGEVQMQVDDDVFDRVESEYVFLQVDGIAVPFFMEEYRFKSDEICLVKFEDVDTQDKARQLTGCEVLFPRDIAETDEHDLTYAELVGYELVDDNTDKVLGKIAYVDDTTENILFELENEILIPAAEELIVDVDSDNHRIRVNVPEGLV